MKKEMFVAVLIGLSLGLIITYGIYTARVSLSRPRTEDTLATPVATPSPELSKVVLHSPEDESVVTEAGVTIAGATTPRTVVVIVLNQEETITTADDTGNFSITAELTPGNNSLRVYQYDENGNETILQRTVVYMTAAFSEEKAIATPSASTSPVPTTKASATPKATASPKPGAAQ